MNKHRPAFRYNIFIKLLFAIGFSSLLPLFGLWYFGSYQYQQLLDEKTNKHFAHITGQLAAQLDAWQSTNTRLLRQMSQLQAIRSGDHQQQNPMLASVTNTYEWIYLAYTIGKDGYMSGRSDARSRPVHNSEGIKQHFRGDREYHQSIMAGASESQQLLINRTHNRPAFIQCVQYPSLDQNNIDGSLCIAMTVAALSRAIASISVGSSGYAVLLDQHNRLIAHGNPRVLSNHLQDLSEHTLVLQAQENKPYLFMDENGHKKIAYHKTTATGWKLFVEQDYNDAFSPLVRSQQDAWLFLMVTSILCVAIAFFMARRLSSPIHQITYVANRISRGEYRTPLPREAFANDEIGDLSEAVERMRKTIQIVMGRLKK